MELSKFQVPSMKDCEVENLCFLGTGLKEWEFLRRREKHTHTLNKQIKERKQRMKDEEDNQRRKNSFRFD